MRAIVVHRVHRSAILAMAVALAVTGGLVLSACASGGASSQRVQSAQQTATARPSGASPSATPTTAPTASAAPSPAPSSATPPGYARVLQMPTCDTIIDHTGLGVIAGEGMDYSQSRAPGYFGVSDSRLQGIITTYSGLNCTWFAHYSKRTITISTTIVPADQFSTINAVLLADGFSHHNIGAEEYVLMIADPNGNPDSSQTCELPQTGHEAQLDYFICVQEVFGTAANLVAFDAANAFILLNT